MSAPLQRTVEANVPAVAAAADDDTVLAQAPYAGSVTAVYYVPEDEIIGADDDSRSLQLLNRGQDGTGDTVVASRALAEGVDAAASDEIAVSLSPTDASRVIAEGDTLVWSSEHIGEGLADPGGLARVIVDRS